MLETTVLTVVITALLWAWRSALGAVRRVWGVLRWWERVLVVLAFAPIPGPFDELLGAWVVARGSRRLR